MNIYVSNLSFRTSETELKDLFAEFGTVTSAKIITDRETNRSRGFAFVEMSSTEEGNAAIKGLDQKEIQGRAISVTVAREKEGRSNNKNSFSRSGNRRFS